jgi:transcription initiation factor IIF auxiliary subunit
LGTRQNEFKLESAGWGTFRIHAQIHLKDGGTLKLHHDLVLTYPDSAPSPA